jgi:muconate cycloisomerase
VEVELADGGVGYGETLPRPYVSGESLETVIDAIRDPMLKELSTLHPERFAEALERIDALPTHDDLGQIISAARAGVELALLDAYSRHFEKPIGEAVGWLGLPGFSAPGSIARARVSGVLSADHPARLRWSIRKMRWYGLRDFKLKVGPGQETQPVETAVRQLGRRLKRGQVTLRLDANGAWDRQTATEELIRLSDLPISTVEQPLPRGSELDLVPIKRTVTIPLMHDESVVTLADAERLLALKLADAFNIRLSKNGGFLASIRLAHFCRKHDIVYQLGCMVGETSILSAAGHRFLENVPDVRYVESSYGRFLLKGDVVDRPLRFGYAGKLQPLSGLGWGVQVRQDLLKQYADQVIELRL